MLNNPKVTKAQFGAPVQILANVEHQMSVGVRVPQSLGTVKGAKKIALAGTPIFIDFADTMKEVKAPAAASGSNAAVEANAVLLHDVDVTEGTANGTGLYFGVVNINRLDASVQAKVTAGVNTIGAVSFLKL